MTASNVSKVVLGKEVLVDLTADTVKPETLLEGITAHDAAGAQIIGTLVQKAGGRPFATGTASAQAPQYNISVSGLSFVPKIVIIVSASGAHNGTFCAFCDTENNFLKSYYSRYYSDTWSYGLSMVNCTMTTTSNGFTVVPGSMSFTTTYTFRWWAIGAAS